MSVGYSLEMRVSSLMLAVHDEPSPDKDVFMDNVADWILARSVEPVQIDDAKPRL